MRCAAAALLVSSTGAFANEESIPEWQQAVVDGSPEALVELALFYGTNPAGADEQRAFDLLFIAANRFDQPVAQVNLGVFYQFGGEGMNVDLPRAAYWYARAARSGNPAAQSRLADLYSRGSGTDVNFEKAADLYTKAADSGFAEAQVELGYIFEMGDLGEVDYDAAMGLYQEAADQGNVIAQYNLAEMYELGKGGPVNLDQARSWYGRSAEGGLDEAKEALQRLQ